LHNPSASFEVAFLFLVGARSPWRSGTVSDFRAVKQELALLFVTHQAILFPMRARVSMAD